MRIDVRFLATVRGRADRKSAIVALDGDASPTIRDVLAHIEGEYPGLAGELLAGDRTALTLTVLRNRKSAD